MSANVQIDKVSTANVTQISPMERNYAAVRQKM